MKPFSQVIVFLIVAFGCFLQSWSAESDLAACARMLIVTGEVGANPGRLYWKPDLTLLAAIAACGGFAREELPAVIIIRNGLRKGGRIVAHPKAIHKGTERDPKLWPGDIVELPK
jgi:hypothetical protein